MNADNRKYGPRGKLDLKKTKTLLVELLQAITPPR
jgi:cytochrome c